MLGLPKQEVHDVVFGEKRRVACLDDRGMVVSLQVIDTAKYAATCALYAAVRFLDDTEACNEGWRLQPDGSYRDPNPPPEPDAMPTP